MLPSWEKDPFHTSKTYQSLSKWSGTADRTQWDIMENKSSLTSILPQSREEEQKK